MDSNSALQQATGQADNVGNLLQEEKTQIDPMQQNLQQTMNKSPADPNLQKQPEQPKSEFTQDATEWVGIMNVLAGLGGAKSRQGATTALQAFSGGLDSFKQGKIEQLKQQQEQWKTASASVVDNNKAQIEAYKSALQDKKTSIDEQMANIKTIASQYHNDIVSQLAEQRNFTAIARVMDMMQSNTEKLQLAYDKLHPQVESAADQAKAAHDAKSEWINKYVDPTTKKPIPGAPDIKQYVTDAMRKAQGGGAGGLSEESIAQKAKAIAEEGASYSDVGVSTRSSKNPEKDAIDNYIAKNYPDADLVGAKIGRAGKTAGATAGARREVLTSQAIGELDELIPQAKSDLNQLKNSRFPDYNSLVNSAEYKAGDPDIVGAANTVQEVANAYTAVMVRGGMRSDAAQAAADALLKTNFANAQWDRALTTMQRNSKSVMTGIQKGQKNFLSGISGDDSGGEASDPLGIR